MDNSLKKGRITNFSNKIGLFDPEKQTFINGSGDVVLSFPFKDCVLEGGMSDEESGREEKFFHETLDRADIDTLRDPKVLTKFEKIDKNGIHAITNPSEIDFWDEDGELKENLLIKGNNLIALYSLRKKLAGKVKLIYIDPPYNTGSDGFRYNDNFNHSTWLVFMRNRLEIARELLRDDGVIFVQCDDNEQAYLKVLMDEVFGRGCFISTIAVASDARTRNYEALSKTHEFILVYGGTEEYTLFQCHDKDKKFQYEDDEGGFDLYELRNRNTEFNDKNRPNLLYSFYLNPNRKDSNGLFEISLEKREGFIEVLPQKSNGIQTVWRWGKDKALQNINTVLFGKESTNGFQIVKKYREFTKPYSTIWNEKEILTDRGTLQIKALFGKKIFNFPKPEELIKKIIELGTEDNDIILDFHIGSGTTCAVAHKMGRQWIGIEQMDYIEDVAKKRLQKVIEGEQGGISKSVEWQGGGSFIYMELKAYNIEFIERIESARTKEELHTVYVEMASNAFLQFWFDRRDWEKDENYKSLPLEEQKVKLRELLDLNQLYLNVGDMNDSRHHVSALEKALTEKFYGKE